MERLVRLGAVALLLAALPAHAQQRGTVTGQVTGEGQRPLAGALVSVAGTELRTSTNAEGRFQLANVPAGQRTITANQLGYTSASRTVALAAGQTATVDLALAPSAVALDELVVTGTAGQAVRREQPAVVASVDVDNLVSRGVVTSVRDALTARVPGVSVTATSGSSGTSQRIRIRGASSISLSNEPLIFIDGVRADSRTREPFGFGIGGQGTSRLFDVEPEDIESIEIVKGPAAATLYGADASAGVIQIITKKGRAGSGRFQQSLSTEYNSIDPNYTPPANFGVCTAALVAESSASDLCRGQAVGTVVSDNPLVREGAFRTGNLRSLGYTARGGGDNYGYYLSLGYDKEEGTLPNNELDRRSGRFNFTFIPSSKLSIEAGAGFSRNDTRLPNNDNNIYGFLTQGLQGRPTTVGNTPQNGWQNAFRNADALALIRNQLVTLRYNPSLQFNYTPASWFTHRLVVGGDISQGSALQFYPRNSTGFFQGSANTGRVAENRNNFTSYTIDYLGNVRAAFGADDWITSDLSFGAQYINERVDALYGIGVGLTTNAARMVDAASQISADQEFEQEKSLGFLAQEQIGFNDRLFLQLGARIDQNSSFGTEADAFFLPKLGMSWVVSEEPFFGRLAGAIPTLRLRAAYGATGRSPDVGASLSTYDPAPYATDAAASAPGVIPLNPGNAGLKPERGTEVEAGLEAGLLGDRLSLELTYFNKRSTDLLVQRPLSPSEGFFDQLLLNRERPFINLGESVNRGWEYAVRASLLRTRRLQWDVRLAGTNLNNELVKLGEFEGVPIQPFGTLARFTPGRPLGSNFTRRILSVDEAAGRVIVSDTIEYVGQPTPTYEGNAGTTLTFGGVQLSGQLDWKGGFTVYNRTRTARERGTNPNSGDVLVPGRLSREQLLRLQGPYFTAAGAAVAQTNVLEEYLEPGDFMRLREVSASFAVPARIAQRFRMSGATLTLGAQNLALWTDYSGADPEVVSTINEVNSGNGFVRDDFFTLPPTRRLVAKLNVQF